MKWSKTKLIKYLLLLIAFVALLPIIFYFWFLLFGGDYSISLPAGYSLVRVYAGAVLMSDSKHNVVITPNIDGYKVYEHVIVGHVTNEKLPPDETTNSVPGFFILDVKTDRVQRGLSEQAWTDSLRTYGITEKPRLHKPSRFDRDYK